MAIVKVAVDFHFQKEFRIGELESYDEANIQMVKYVDVLEIITDLIGEELDNNLDKYVTVTPCPDETEADYEVE